MVSESATVAAVPAELPPPRRYKRIPLLVDAHKVTTKNLAAIADWCGGQVVDGRVVVPCFDGKPRPAAPGDWVTQNTTGGRRRLGVIRGLTFAARFTPVESGDRR